MQTKVTKVPLQFSVNRTETCTISELFDGKSVSEPTNLKLIINLTDIEKAAFDEDLYKESLLNNSNIKNVTITYDIIRSLHVRSKHIIEIKTPQDKFKEYAQVEKIECNDEILNMIKEIEEKLVINYSTPKHSFTLLKTKLRGSIGIYRGMQKEEIEVDFSAYPDSLITIAGPCGMGKSTFIENCHPYPRMMTKPGTLQSHFFLKDSFRELLYIDEEGTYYKIHIDIDGKTEKGKVKYFVYTGKDVNNLTGLPDLNGNSGPYEEWLKNTFGPISLFLRTSFFAKEQTEGVPDLARATKGEKKELFSTLLGLDELKQIALEARELAKSYSKDLDILKAKVPDVSSSAIPKIEDSIEETKNKIKEISNKKSKLEKRLLKLTEDLDKFNPEKERELEKTISTAKASIETDSKNLEKAEFYTANKEKYKTLCEIRDKISALELKINEYKHSVHEPLLEKKNSITSRIMEADKQIAKTYAEYSAYESTACFTVEKNCPVCNQALTAEKVSEAEEKVQKNKEKLVLLHDKCKEDESLKKTLSEELFKLKFESSESKLDSLRAELFKLETDFSYDEKKLLTQIEACKTISDSIGDIEVIKNNIEEKKGIKEAAEKALSLLDVDSYTTALEEKKNVENELKSLPDEISNLNISLGGFISNLNETKKDLALKEELETSIEEQSRKAMYYRIIEKAFGTDGIQALELEAFAPDIADIANRILKVAYDGRYKVSFQTLRIGAQGQYIEDFNILVYDENYGEPQPLEWLCSGETVWIRAALFNAFSIVRMKSSGISMKTIFADEVDGSLDPVSRMRYLKMIEVAHEECGATQTILITHSSELIDSIPQRIRF